MKKENSFKCIKNTPALTYIKGEVYSDDLCALLPEYFAPYLFTTHDNVSIYENDKYWIWQPRLKDLSEVECFSGPQLKESIGFSTRQAAEAYLKELNKPKYQSGKVYKDPKNQKCIFVLVEFNGIDEACTNYGFGFHGNWMKEKTTRIFEEDGMIEATPEEWEAALIKEAKRLGFKEGEMIDKTPFAYLDIENKYNKVKLKGNSFSLIQINDCLIEDTGFDCVYLRGKWATVIPEPKAKLYCNVYEGVDHAVIRPSIQECELAYGKLEITTQKYLGIYELIKIK